MGNSTTQQFKRNATEIPLGPPRFIGDWTVDQKQLVNWLADFIKITVSQTGLLDPQYQQTVGEIDFEHLPDPGATTIARAQATANKAWEAGETFKVDLENDLKVFAFGGSFTISDGANQGNPVFPFDLGSTNYRACVTPQTASGSPTNDSFRIVAMAKGSGGMAVFVAGAPGAGNSVTYDYIVIGPAPNLTTRNDEEA